MTTDLQEQARAAKNAYQRTWRKANREKVREYDKRYWAKKAKTQSFEGKGATTDAENAIADIYR